MSILIKNGRVIDPKNNIDSKLNILTEGRQVACVTRGEPQADMTIDAEGRIVTPGFIDIHMHEDFVDENGHLENDETKAIFNCSLRMGVTTVLGGQCGISRYDPAKYLDIVDRDGASVNVALLAGHAWAREAAGHGDKYTQVSSEELERLCGILKGSLDAGCFGISYGLRYVPGTDEREFSRTASLCAPRDDMIAAHVRDDAAEIFTAVKELCEIGKRWNLTTQVSHIGSMGGFGQMKELLRMIDEYRLNGLRVSCDCYPYYAYSTAIGECTYDDGWMERYNCDYSAVEMCEGRYKGMRCTKEIFDEERSLHPEHLTTCFVMREDDVDMALAHPNVMLGSDGILNGGQGHPRAAGAFTRLFAEFVRGGKVSLYDAVRKVTSMPADVIGLKSKGSLAAGCDADIVIFDPDRIRDLATFSDPVAPGEGIDYVLVGGQIASKDCRVINGHLGRSVRKR